MKQRKVLVGIAIAIFVILLLYWLLVAEDMKPWLSAMVPSVAQQFITWFCKIWLFHDNFPYRNPVSLPQKKRLLPAVMGYGLIFYKNI